MSVGAVVGVIVGVSVGGTGVSVMVGETRICDKISFRLASQAQRKNAVIIRKIRKNNF